MYVCVSLISEVIARAEALHSPAAVGLDIKERRREWAAGREAGKFHSIRADSVDKWTGEGASERVCLFLNTRVTERFRKTGGGGGGLVCLQGEYRSEGGMKVRYFHRWAGGRRTRMEFWVEGAECDGGMRKRSYRNKRMGKKTCVKVARFYRRCS